MTEAKTAHPDLRGGIVAVQHAAHFAAGKEVLDNGLHLLMEKPMTLYAKEARALVELADQKGLQIQMGYTFPYLAPVQEAKKRIDDGLLGEIEYITCSMSSMTIEFLRGKPEEYRSTMNYKLAAPGDSTYSDPKVAGGGQGYLQITHSASMMFYLAPGLRADTVVAFMNNLDCKVDVADAIAVRMNNGTVATVGSTGNLGKGDGGIVEVHLHGSKGRVLVDAISGLMHMRLHDGTDERIAPTNPPYPGEIPSQRFVELILDGGDNFFPGKTNGLYTVELLDAAYRSAAKDGMPVKIASLYE
jgi:predicted dehydrogenase